MLSLMPMKHRKLYPTPTAANQTTDCPDFCDPADCPYNCYPYPDYYFLPPPPPPPPPSPPLSPHEHRLSPYFIVIVSLLASFFLLFCYYVMVAKPCSGWCGGNNRQPQAEAENEEEESLEENRVDHPIWYITTIGLHQSIINSITVCRYKKGEGLIEGSDCSVCLSEFQQGETLRLLPKCNHAFHISCIDTWLRTHTNCPLCRAHIFHDPVISTPPPPPPPPPPMVPVNQNPDSLSPIARTQMENSDVDGGLRNNHERNEFCENRGGAEEAGEIMVITDERISKEDGNSNSQVIIVDIDVCKEVKNDITPIGRSFSMDSLTAATLCLGLPNHSPLESEMGLVNRRENAEKTLPTNALKPDEGDSSTIKTPISMKRSFSCGGRFFSSRQNRSSNSVLPL